MARGKAHDDGTRAAVLAALLAGQGVSELAREHQLSRSTIINWRDAAGIGSTPVQPQKKGEISDLVTDLLREVLTTLQLQAVEFRDPEWLKKQGAADVAVLFGVVADKGLRLLSAIEPVEPGEDSA